MLRIQRRDVEVDHVDLVLYGLIIGVWVEALERECEELIGAGQSVALDLAGVTFIGRSGMETLGRLGRAGVAIAAASPLIADMLELEGIAVVRDGGATNHGKPPVKGIGESTN